MEFNHKTMKKKLITILAASAVPFLVQAQTTADDVQSLHNVLQNVYDQMMPLCSQLISVARGIAAFAATFYIGYRVWRHIANAEPIDFFPLLRPFVLAILIGIFPKVLGVMNGILQPTVTVTAGMVKNSDQTVKTLLAQGISGMGITTLDPSLGAQAAAAGIQTAKTLLSKKVKAVIVTVRAGHRVLLQSARTGH